MESIITAYHFCASLRVPAIHSQGLRFGVVPLYPMKDGKWQFAPNFQWLTTNPEWKQPWDIRFRLKEDRTQVRLTLHIPATELQSLLRWRDVQAKFGWKGNAAEEFNFGLEGDNWLLWQGAMPPDYIHKTEERPTHHE